MLHKEGKHNTFRGVVLYYAIYSVGGVVERHHTSVKRPTIGRVGEWSAKVLKVFYGESRGVGEWSLTSHQ